MSFNSLPIGDEQSSSYSIESATLKTSRSDISVEISSVLSELVVYEHLHKPYVTGYLIMIDGDSIIEGLDIQGAEKVQIVLKRSTDAKGVKPITFNFIIKSIKKQVQTNETTQAVVFQLVDENLFKSNLQNVNKVYEGQPYEIINNLLKDYLDRDDLQTSAGFNALRKTKVIVPHMQPLEAAEWIRNRSINENGYPFYFYKTAITDEYIFADAEALLSSQVINPDFPYINAQSSSSSSTAMRNFVIEKISQTDIHDLYHMISEGVVGSSSRYYNITTGDFDHVDFNINNDLFSDIDTLNNKQARAMIDGFLKIDDTEISNYKSRISTMVSNAAVYDDIRSYDEDDNHKNKVKARALQYILNKAPLKITVDGSEFIHGDENYGIGNSIRILTKTRRETDESVIDVRTSGDYLIAAANYTFKFSKSNKVETTMILTKLANYQSDRVPTPTGVFV